MKTLSQIFAEGNSDKASLHGYDVTYEKLFAPFRLKGVRLLELGFLGGDSLEAWAKFFPHPATRIVGLDLMDRLYRPTDGRISIHFGDCAKREVLEGIGSKWDVIIDDAGHFSGQQIETFNILWPSLIPGGQYVVEDLHAIHSKQHSDHPLNIVQYMAKVASDLQDPNGATGSAKYNPYHPWSDLESITLQKGLAIIRKRIISAGA